MRVIDMNEDGILPDEQSADDGDRRQSHLAPRHVFHLNFSLKTLLLFTCLAACLFAAYRFMNRTTLITHPDEFDGRTDVVLVADRGALDLEACFTVEAYVKVPLRQSTWLHTSCIVAKGKGAMNTDHNYYLGIVNRDRRLHFHIGDGFGKYQEIVSKTRLPVEQWTHVAAVRSEDKLEIYIDGKLDATTRRRLNQVSNDAPLRIGATEGKRSPHYIQAQLDQVRIWNRALAGKDFQQRSRGNSHRPSSGLVLESVMQQPGDQSSDQAIPQVYPVAPESSDATSPAVLRAIEEWKSQITVVCGSQYSTRTCDMGVNS